MSVVKRVLRKIRKTRRPSPPRDTSMDWLVQIRANQNRQAAWEQDKIAKRDENFRKLLIGQEKYRAQQDAEKERQKAINDVRLKNLKKARRARSKK